MAAEHIGREQEIQALGRTWRLSRFTRALWAQFLEWARKVIPNPLDVIKPHLKDFTVEQQNLLVEKAGERALNHLQENGKDTQALLNSADGAAYLLYLLLQQHHPEATLDDAF